MAVEFALLGGPHCVAPSQPRRLAAKWCGAQAMCPSTRSVGTGASSLAARSFIDWGVGGVWVPSPVQRSYGLGLWPMLSGVAKRSAAASDAAATHLIRRQATKLMCLFWARGLKVGIRGTAQRQDWWSRVQGSVYFFSWRGEALGLRPWFVAQTPAQPGATSPHSTTSLRATSRWWSSESRCVLVPCWVLPISGLTGTAELAGVAVNTSAPCAAIRGE